MSAELADWFKERPAWLQYAAKLLVEKGSRDQKDIEEFANICVKEVLGELDGIDYSFCSTVFTDPAAKSLRLNSIGDIKGINALSPKKPLQFGNGNLSVIYGQNSSGKSGYVRILKHLCGARHPGKLHQNVYSSTPTKQSCSVTYEHDGASVPNEWEAESGTIDDLRSVDIFDTQCGHVYVNGENEVSYEPPILSFFSDLTGICEAVSRELEGRIAKLVSKKPVLPAEYTLTGPGKWYSKISAITHGDQVTTHCEWTQAKEGELEAIGCRLLEQAPAEKAKLLRKQNEYLGSIIHKLETINAQLSNENCQAILVLRQEAKQKGEAAKVAAEQLFREVPLEGIGSIVWGQLWEQARKYSQEIAYAEKAFPYVGDDSLCVLCHQPLSEAAKKRVQSFEDYVKGEMQKDAETAQKAFEKAIAEIDDIPLATGLKPVADAAALTQEAYADLQGIYDILKARKESIVADALTPLTEIATWVGIAKQLSSSQSDSAKKYDEDAQKDNRAELNARRLELEATKWLSQQRKPVEEELMRLRSLNMLQSASRLTNTKGLSQKKGELAETLITDAFVQRFNDELAKLNAARIKVELVKTKVAKGRVLHCLRLKGAYDGTLSDVLSEGEYRMISLAAFLADVTGKAQAAPFVFDDPISSLDQDFEEAVVRRLVSLAKDRQVIVFTHRLSLLGLIQDYSKQEDIDPEVVCIRREAWGTGEPGDTPLFAKKPEKALNALLDGRLAQARKLQEEHGQEVYAPLAKALCSDFRILLERMIECELMADVVQRYRRAVNTMGKIGKLAHISEADCKYFDEMMTKYSRYEHSQPGEAPVQLPNPDEFKADFEGLKKWREGFVARAA